MTLVTVVTATWGRPTAIFDHAIASVEHQTHPEIEHIIVTDGFNRELKMALSVYGYTVDGTTTSTGLQRRLVTLGRNWTSRVEGEAGIGSVPRAVGAWMAAGDYICYFDDDNDFAPDHIERLVAVIEEQNVDLALCPWPEYPDPSGGVADTNTFMHKVDVLQKGTWPLAPYNADHVLVSGWIGNGVKWGYHADKQTVILNRLNGGKGAPE